MRKVSNEALEESLYQWVIGRRDDAKVVTRKTIKLKALQLNNEFSNGKCFNASDGWCANFLKRYSLSTRQKTHQSQRLPDELVPKVVRFFKYLRCYLAEHNIKPENLTAMDETCVFLENVSNRTISITGKPNFEIYL